MLSERKKCIRLSERKYCTRPQKKMAYRPAKVHVSSKKKTAVLDLDERQSRHHNRDTAALPMSNIVRMATIKVDQGGNKSNSVCSLPSRISKISDKISQKINPHKSSKDFDVQNPEKIINNKATTHRHKFPATRGFLIQICADLRKILQN